MILKVLALPVLFVVTIACILGNLITNISSYVIALLLLIIAGCSINPLSIRFSHLNNK